MIILDKDTHDGFAKITKNTKKVLACFFGFFPYAREEDVFYFIEEDLELGIKLAEDVPVNLTQSLAIEVYNAIGGGHVDLGYVLTKEFQSKEEAKEFLEGKIKNSEYVNKKIFSEIEYIDADEFYQLLKNNKNQQEKTELAKNIFNKKFKDFLTQLKSDFKDNTEVCELVEEHLSKYKE